MANFKDMADFFARRARGETFCVRTRLNNGSEVTTVLLPPNYLGVGEVYESYVLRRDGSSETLGRTYNEEDAKISHERWSDSLKGDTNE